MANVILGGGISGLSAAFYLSKTANKGIKLYESSQRLGGWIKSLKHESGTIFEIGPRTIRCQGKEGNNALELAEELGLTSSIYGMPITSEAAQNRMIYVNNQVITLPGVWGTLLRGIPPFIPPFTKAVMKDLTTPKIPLEDDSVYNFIARRFGEPFAEYLFSAMVCGIFGGDAKKLSIRYLFNSLFESEQLFGNLTLGLFLLKFKELSSQSKKKEVKKESNLGKNWTAFTFKDGLETLPNALNDYLKKRDVEINLEKKCSKINFENGKALLTINGEVEVVETLFSTIPSRNLAAILQDDFLKEELSGIPYVDIAVVNVEYEGDLLEKKGFGLLVPPNQNLSVLGIVFDSCIVPQEGKTVLTVMMGGYWFEHHFGPNPDESLILKTAKNHIRSILKIDKEPNFSMVNILRNCIPQYVVGEYPETCVLDHKLQNHSKEVSFHLHEGFIS